MTGKKEVEKGKCPPTYSSPRWTAEITDCSLPMTLDTYSNCSFGCVYCFAQYQRGVGCAKKNYLEKNVSSINPQKIKDLFDLKNPKSQFNPYIAKHKPIQWGGLSDEFDEYERKFGVTLELLKYFKEKMYPISFSTKATWFLDDPRYREVLDGAPWNAKFSIITANEMRAKIIEKRVPTPNQRLDAIQKWSELCTGGATLRLRPFIIGVSDDYEELIRKAYNKGATAVSTEFFCVEGRATPETKKNYKVISDLIGFDLFEFYKTHSDSTGYYRLNRNVKKPIYTHMKEICDELGMRLYISDAHFKELSHNACCCGLPPEWDYSRGNYSYALQVAKKNGVVHFSDISVHMMDNFDFPWGKAEGFNTNSQEKRFKYEGMTMKDYLRNTWNNPLAGQSPYKMFGKILQPDGIDENGDTIYRFHPEYTIENYGESHEPNFVNIDGLIKPDIQ